MLKLAPQQEEALGKVKDAHWLQTLRDNLHGQNGHFLVLIGDERQLLPFGGSFLSALTVVKTLLANSVAQWWRYSLAQELTDLEGNPIDWQKLSGIQGPDRHSQLCGLINKSLRWPAGYQGKLVLILDNLELLIPNRAVNQLHPFESAYLEHILSWAGRDELIVRSGNLILAWVRSQGDLHPWLRTETSNIVFQELPRPDQTTKADFILWQTEQLWAAESNDSVQSAVQRAEKLAGLSRGLSLHQLAKLLKGKTNDQFAGVGQIQTELKEKRQQNLLAEAGDVLTLLEAPLSLDKLGGLKAIKKYLLAVLERFCAGNGTAQGSLLFMGPPGTGKTAVAAALAQEADLACISPLNVQEKWLGASERNLERLLQACLQYAPLILFLDELDLTFGKRVGDGDGGASNRLFQRLLTFLGDRKMAQQVLVIGASNWPNRLDQALIRAGRFQAKIPFFLPTVAERGDILKQLLRCTNIKTAELARFAQASKLELASGADLNALVAEAALFAEQADRKQIEPSDLEQALTELILAKDKTSTMLMSLLAAQYATRRSFLPTYYQKLLDSGQLETEVRRLENLNQSR